MPQSKIQRYKSHKDISLPPIENEKSKEKVSNIDGIKDLGDITILGISEILYKKL